MSNELTDDEVGNALPEEFKVQWDAARVVSCDPEANAGARMLAKAQMDLCRALAAALKYNSDLVDGMRPLLSKPCVLCTYENGVLIESCPIHEALDTTLKRARLIGRWAPICPRCYIPMIPRESGDEVLCQQCGKGGYMRDLIMEAYEFEPIAVLQTKLESTEGKLADALQRAEALRADKQRLMLDNASWESTCDRLTAERDLAEAELLKLQHTHCVVIRKEGTVPDNLIEIMRRKAEAEGELHIPLENFMDIYEALTSTEAERDGLRKLGIELSDAHKEWADDKYVSISGEPDIPLDVCQRYHSAWAALEAALRGDFTGQTYEEIADSPDIPDGLPEGEEAV